MKKAEFWTRYFFRVHQIQQEEERRKALLSGEPSLLSPVHAPADLGVVPLVKEDEDFSWEDEEEEKTTTTVPTPQPPTSVSSAPEPAAPHVDVKEVPPSKASSTQDLAAPSAVSPRHSSEGSYDVVSSNVSTSGDAEKERKAVDEEEEEEEEEDSDWE
jgi:hypothetical protein